MIIQPDALPSASEAHADAVVVGTGAGGFIVAALLAEAGLRVIVLEAGGYYTGKDFNQREKDMIGLLYEERGARATADQGITIIQAACVGGTPVINNCICFRTPPHILEEWRLQHQLDALTEAELKPHFEAVERDQKVQKLTPDLVNRNDTVLQRGAQALGIHTDTFMHNRDGCIKSGFCMIGCSYDRKQNSLTVYVPRALKARAVLYPHARADRILVENGRAAGVEVIAQDRTNMAPRRLTVRAPRVFVCAGSINTPQLLLNSKVANSGGQVGQHLSLHPLSCAMGYMEEEVRGYAGIPQCVYTHDFAEEKGEGEGGYIIEGIFAHPGLYSTAVPGFGAEAQQMMAEYNHYAALYSQVHDSSRGSVGVSATGRPVIRYSVNDRDWKKIRHSHKAMARIFLAAGAKWVTTTHTEPVRIRTESDLALLDAAPYRANSLTLFSAHPQGSCRMGGNPKDSVVNVDGESHDVPGLYLADASIFPSPVGVNPMITVNALAHRIATRAIKKG